MTNLVGQSAASINGLHRTELGLAELVAKRHGDDLRYCGAIGWLVWQGERWKPDDTGEVERRVVETIQFVHRCAIEPSRDDRKELSKFAFSCESSGRIRGVMDLARILPGIAVTVEDLDADPYLLNCQNGTIDLRSGELRPNCREDLCTKVASASYDPDAQSDGTFLRFLADVFPDPEMRAFARRAIGASLGGVVREHVLHVWYGPTGGNGKSTFANAIADTLGDYAMIGAPKLLVQTGHEAHPTQFADLHGKRFVALSESGETTRLDAELAKRLTGGDRIKARRMRMDFFEFEPSHTIFLSTNHRPVIRDTSPAIWRRVKLWPFTRQFASPDLDMPAKLHADRDALLAWSVAGCREWLVDGLAPPTAVQVATDEYQAVSDALGTFIADHCVIDVDARVASAELYARYNSWIDSAGEEPMTATAFGRALGRRGYGRRVMRPDQRTYYLGIG